MILTDEQRDALLEVINIAFGRAAASLSELTGQRVLLTVPKAAVCPIHELVEKIAVIVEGEVATVQQIFKGPVSGSAMLVLDYEGAILLSGLLMERRAPLKRLDLSDREALTEVGNIILNACLGTFGNLLQVHITFLVPRLHVQSLNTLLDTITIDSEELQYALVITTNFQLRESSVGGYLIVALGVTSLERLIQALARLG
jgi:chemotaxis protein CheC